MSLDGPKLVLADPYHVCKGDNVLIKGVIHSIDDPYYGAYAINIRGTICNFDHLVLYKVADVCYPDKSRLFKKGDIVRYVERDGRVYGDAPPVGSTCRVILNEDRARVVTVEFKFSENEEPAVHDVPFYHLELVTPIEAMEPYSVEEVDVDSFIFNPKLDPDRDSESAFHIKYTDAGLGEITIVKTYYESYIYSYDRAKADAEAECARLNSEHRKEKKL